MDNIPSLPSHSPKKSVNSNSRHLTPEQYAALRAEAAAPYRGLRLLIYWVFGASGLIGAFTFLTQLLVGNPINEVLPNLGLQLGVVALMVWLYQLEHRKK